jgi:2'-5' RNA ligase
MDKARVFFALWPSEAAAMDLHRVARAARAAGGGRAMRRETLHLTLAFLGDVARERIPDLAAIAAAVHAAAFTLRLDQVGYWRHNHILWAGCAAPDAGLLALAEELRSGLQQAGFLLAPAGFTPHVTLVRNAAALAEPMQLESIEWPVTEFLLMESHPSSAGADYQPLARWPLQ